MLPAVWEPSPDYREAKGVITNYVDGVRKRHLLNRGNPEVLGRRRIAKRRCKLAHMLHCKPIRIDGDYFTTLPQQVNKISAEAAAGIKHSYWWLDVPAQNLIEQVDVDLAELLLKRHVPKLL